MEKFLSNRYVGFMRMFWASVCMTIGLYAYYRDEKVFKFPASAWMWFSLMEMLAVLMHFQARILEKIEQKG